MIVSCQNPRKSATRQYFVHVSRACKSPTSIPILHSPVVPNNAQKRLRWLSVTLLECGRRIQTSPPTVAEANHTSWIKREQDGCELAVSMYVFYNFIFMKELRKGHFRPNNWLREKKRLSQDRSSSQSKNRLYSLSDHAVVNFSLESGHLLRHLSKIFQTMSVLMEQNNIQKRFQEHVRLPKERRLYR